MAQVALADGRARFISEYIRIYQGGRTSRFYLTPTEALIVNHMRRRGYITARDAMVDYGLSAGSLTRRMTSIEDKGILITRSQHRHPVTDRLYTRYSLDGTVVA